MEESAAMIDENCVILEREREFRAWIEQKRMNVRDAEVNTDPDFELVEQENCDLQNQLS